MSKHVSGKSQVVKYGEVCPFCYLSGSNFPFKVSPLSTALRVGDVCGMQQAEEWEGIVCGFENSLFPQHTCKRSVINFYLGSNKTTIFTSILSVICV